MIKSALKILLSCKAEMFLFLIMLSQHVRSVTDQQLIQDKICIYEKGLSVEFCKRLSKVSEKNGDSPQDISMKTTILKEATTYQMYYMGVAFLPSMFTVLFLGSWCDNYVRGRKALMIFTAVGSCLEILIKLYMSINFDINYNYMFLSGLPSALGAGLATAFTAVFSYIPATTPTNLRPIRFMLVEVITFLTNPIGAVIGGYLLSTTKLYDWQPIGKNGQLLNYSLVLITGLGISILSFIWVLFFINEDRDRKMLEKYDTNKVNENLYELKKGGPRPLPRTISENIKQKNPILLLFDCANARDIWKTCTRKRDNKARKQLYMITATLVIYLLANIGPLYIMFQFAQKVYLWDAPDFSYWNSIGTLANTFGTIIATLVCTKLLNIHDIPLAIVGCVGYFISNIIRGTFLNFYGFYISALVGSIGPIGNVGLRSYISKIVEKHELGKVFSFIGAADSLAPLLASFVFTLVFNNTIDTYPGTVFQATAFLLFIPLAVMFWIDIYCKNRSDSTDGLMVSKHKNDTKAKAKSKPSVLSDTNGKSIIETNNNLIQYEIWVREKKLNDPKEFSEPLTYRTSHSKTKVRSTEI